jgi:hypothetical protein
MTQIVSPKEMKAKAKEAGDRLEAHAIACYWPSLIEGANRIIEANASAGYYSVDFDNLLKPLREKHELCSKEELVLTFKLIRTLENAGYRVGTVAVSWGE